MPKRKWKKQGGVAKRALRCARVALPTALKTTLWILKITIPISLVVTLLSYFGVLGVVSEYLSPAFRLIGLRGEASLVFITGAFLNIYSAIAVITQLPLNPREITILAVMSLIAHNLIVETSVQRKTGSKGWHIVTLRLGCAFLSAVILNLLLPNSMTGLHLVAEAVQNKPFAELITGWAMASLRLSVKIVILLSLLMVAQKVLQEFGVFGYLSAVFRPFLKVMGLPESTSFLWIVANFLGLLYGSAVMIDEVQSNRLSRRDADLLNYHIAISHSNLEDMLLFAAIGVSVAWMLIPRLLLSIAAVWARKLFTRGGM